MSLSDIAAAAGVPARTLLDSFKHFRQTSPIRYLKDVRLDNARERLRQRGADTIAQVALDAGFAHLGRFAADYSKRFGELPSDTQRRR
ncbi:helix-turn-helix domain-containing protein [Rhizorhabdus histidinilytica]